MLLPGTTQTPNSPNTTIHWANSGHDIQGIPGSKLRHGTLIKYNKVVSKTSSSIDTTLVFSFKFPSWLHKCTNNERMLLMCSFVRNPLLSRHSRGRTSWCIPQGDWEISGAYRERLHRIFQCSSHQATMTSTISCGLIIARHRSPNCWLCWLRVSFVKNLEFS